MIDGNGNQKFARVSLHYSHLGACTTNGILVKGMSNLLVVGDAGGLLYWTNHQIRLPGFALAHCLVSARKASDWLNSNNKLIISKNKQLLTANQTKTFNQINVSENKLKTINTKHILELEFGDKNLRKKQISSWKKELNQINLKDNSVLLSLSIVNSWNQLLNNKKEPIYIRYNKKYEKQ